jgi:hypothetical protein
MYCIRMLEYRIIIIPFQEDYLKKLYKNEYNTIVFEK